MEEKREQELMAKGRDSLQEVASVAVKEQNEEKEGTAVNQEISGGFSAGAMGIGAKIAKKVKEIFSDRMKTLYFVTLCLQALFALLHFLPVFHVPEIKVYQLSGEIIGAEQIAVNDWSVMGMFADNGLVFISILFAIGLFGSMFGTIRFFAFKDESKKYGGTWIATLYIIFAMISFGVFATIVMGQTSGYSEYGIEAGGLTFGGHLYWIVGVILFLLFRVIAKQIKNMKEEIRIRKKIELEKQGDLTKNGENV